MDFYVLAFEVREEEYAQPFMSPIMSKMVLVLLPMLLEVSVELIPSYFK